MKPVWVKKKAKEKMRLVEFYLPIGEYRLVMSVKGKDKTWREFVKECAKVMSSNAGPGDKKLKKTMGEKGA